MYSIDEIMDMLDWNNDYDIQEKGRVLSKDIRCINVFLRPGHLGHGKNVWDNCAKILAERSDTELEPYLHELFEWLLDMNCPGAYCVWERLLHYGESVWFDKVLNLCVDEAKALNEEIWLDNLLEFQKQRKIHE